MSGQSGVAGLSRQGSAPVGKVTDNVEAWDKHISAVKAALIC